MNFENVFDEFKNLQDIRTVTYERIKSHNLPIVIYGAGHMAKHVTDELNSAGIEVFAYSVDSEYYQPGITFLNRPVYNFNEVSKQADKYVFVLGMNDDRLGGHRSHDFICNKNIIRYALLAISYEPVTKHDILSKKSALIKTLNILADDLSKQTLINYLKLRISWDLSYNEDIFVSGYYFNELTSAYAGGDL